MPERFQLVRITHYRCNEPSAYTYVWAPNTWDEDKIVDAARKARDAYEQVLDRIKNGHTPPPNEYRPGAPIPYKDYPEKTVAAIEAEWAQKRKAWEIWHEAEERAPKTSFGDFLRREGFVALWEHADMEIDIDWGHQHGVEIDYSKTEDDTLPTPEEASGRQPKRLKKVVRHAQIDVRLQ